MWQALGDAVDALSADDGVRCIIVRGAGEKAFSPGNDIGEFATERANKAQAIAYGAVMHATAHALAACRHPLVAQIHGHLRRRRARDRGALRPARSAATSSRFGAPIKNLGLVMAYAEMAPLVRARRRKPSRSNSCSRAASSTRPKRRKKASSRASCRTTEVAAEARATAERIADGRSAGRALAQEVRAPARRPAAVVGEAEHDECFDCFDTEDFRIGYAAFLAKRKPEFRGR